jgi:hypothetical protein
VNWFLRLFPQYRELDALCQMQVERVQACEALETKVSELLVENESLSQDVKNLQEANQELIGEKLRLEDRLASAIDDKARMWDTMQEALREERFAYQTMVNHAVQPKGFGAPYPEAHTLPAEAVRKPQAPGPVGRSARMLPSEAAFRSSMKFVKNYVERMGAEQQAETLEKAG